MTEATKLDRDEILLLLIEECGEVIQAATKCLRFGFDREYPGYGKNSTVLGAEIGDVLGCVDALHFLPSEAMFKARATKIARALAAKAAIGNPDRQSAIPIVGDEGSAP